MYSNSVLATRRLQIACWTSIIAFCGSVAPVCICVGDQWQEQQQRQWQYQAEQQRRAEEERMRQQNEARQQQNYRDMERMQQQQRQMQEQQQRSQQEYDRQQRARYDQEEEDRQRRLRNQLLRENEFELSQPSSPSPNESRAADFQPPVAANTIAAADRSFSASPTALNENRPPMSLELKLFWFVVGVTATLVVIQRNSRAARSSLRSQRTNARKMRLQMVRTLLWRCRLSVLRARRAIGQCANTTRDRIFSLTPSRQLVLRIGYFLVGIVLMVDAVLVIVDSQLAIGFTVMTIGYTVAVVAVWLLPNSPDRGTTRELASSVSLAVASPAPARCSSSTIVPNSQCVDQKSPNTFPRLKEGSESNRGQAQRSRQCKSPEHDGSNGVLCCGTCKKAFNIRGQGDLAVRLVLCPECGTALHQPSVQGPSASDNGIAFTPIISVCCRNCRGLIDVPYTSVGKSISCPRCDADMRIPNNEDRVKRLQCVGLLLHA